MLYYAVGELGLDGGIVVTASHNPKEYTGMKIVRRGALPVGGDSGLDDVRTRRGGGVPRRRHGAARSGAEDIWDGFVAKVLSFVDRDAIRPLRVVVDAANGMGGTMLPPVLEQLPQLDVLRCYFEPDGSFPNHEPNPLLPENREFIVERTRDERRRPGRRVRRRRRPVLLRRRHRRVRPGRLRHRAPRARDAREGAPREGDLRRPRELGRAARDRGGGRRRARQPGRARLHQGADAEKSMRCSPARCPRTTTSATSRRRTPASSRSC